MLCQFFLPNLNVGCALLIPEIKKKLPAGNRFVLKTIHGLNLGTAWLFLTVLWIVMTLLFSRKEN
jgi:hypothetical protein